LANIPHYYYTAFFSGKFPNFSHARKIFNPANPCAPRLSSILEKKLKKFYKKVLTRYSVVCYLIVAEGKQAAAKNLQTRYSVKKGGT